jgi:hypothetical protein
MALGLGADPQPTPAVEAGLRRLLETVRSDQLEDGSWSAWPDTRPPMFGGSHASMTALTTLALTQSPRNDPESSSAQGRAGRWLDSAESDCDPQSEALGLVALARANPPSARLRLLAERILRRPNADGGWSQTADMPSDAWATGQALYALAHAGIDGAQAAAARGRAFLVQSQRDDGSWPMTSRPAPPSGKGADNLVPITGAASAWAVLGLVRAE